MCHIDVVGQRERGSRQVFECDAGDRLQLVLAGAAQGECDGYSVAFAVILVLLHLYLDQHILKPHFAFHRPYKGHKPDKPLVLFFPRNHPAPGRHRILNKIFKLLLLRV